MVVSYWVLLLQLLSLGLDFDQFVPLLDVILLNLDHFFPMLLTYRLGWVWSHFHFWLLDLRTWTSGKHKATQNHVAQGSIWKAIDWIKDWSCIRAKKKKERHCFSSGFFLFICFFGERIPIIFPSKMERGNSAKARLAFLCGLGKAYFSYISSRFGRSTLALGGEERREEATHSLWVS